MPGNNHYGPRAFREAIEQTFQMVTQLVEAVPDRLREFDPETWTSAVRNEERGLFGCGQARSRLLVRKSANKIRRVVRASCAVPARFLRVGAQRPRPVDDAIRYPLGDHFGRRNALAGPLVERLEHVESRRSRSTLAVLHPRHHEEPVERHGIL